MFSGRGDRALQFWQDISLMSRGEPQDGHAFAVSVALWE